MPESDFFSVFEGVPTKILNKSELSEGMSMVDVLAAKTNFLSSNGEARRELKGNAISLNKVKVGENHMITPQDLINDKYLLIGKGKKNNYVVVFE